MPDELLISYRDSGRTATEPFDPAHPIEIAVDGPSVIRVGRGIDPLPEFDERPFKWFTDRQRELLADLAALLDDLDHDPHTLELVNHDVSGRSTYYRHFDLPWSEIKALAREYES